MFKVITEGCAPTRGSKYSACVDLRAREDVVIGAGETVLIPLGVKIDLEKLKKDNLDIFSCSVFGFDRGFEESVFSEEYFHDFVNSHYLQLMLRSSLSKELIITGGVGVIDLDYTGEIMLRVHKPFLHATYDFMDTEDGRKYGITQLSKGQRVAQITLLEHKGYFFGIETEKERVGGFGSTGEM